MPTPAISIVFPARDEGKRVEHTIASAVESCDTPHDIEVVVVDDCSTFDRRPDIGKQSSRLPVRIVRSDKHLGVGAARNLGVRHARGEIVFITDAHVRFSYGWDRQIGRLITPERILALTIRDRNSTWRGFGCRLAVPFMGTRWNTKPPNPGQHVQIAVSSGTVMMRSLFKRIGGYDEGMLHYGGFEPEFSVRAWRSGAEIVLAPTIEVTHRFKSTSERVAFTVKARTAMTHNCLRFGVAHLPEVMILEMVRLHALEYPRHIQAALGLLEERGAWSRREELAANLPYDFAWFVDRFELRDQIGMEIPVERMRRPKPA